MLYIHPTTLKTAKRVLSALLVLAVLLCAAPCANAAAVIEISDVNGLLLLAKNRTSSFRLTASIVISDEEYVSGALKGGWAPVGTESAPFTGTLDGGGYAISNLKVNSMSDSSADVGLFGVLTGTVTNLIIDNSSVSADTSSASANKCVGMLAGKAINATVTNCRAGGTVTAKQTGGKTTLASVLCAGGLIGSAESTAITSCCANVAVTANCGSNNGDVYAGGLVGRCDGGSISTSSAFGAVSGTSTGSTGIVYAGGLVGGADSAAINQCRATGGATATVATSGTRAYAGGICGEAAMCTLTDVQALGAVKSTANAGGIWGIGFISDITGGFAGGALTGSKKDGMSPAMGSYSSAAKVYASEATSVSGAAQLSASALKTQSSYSGLNFTSVWQITDSGAALKTAAEKSAGSGVCTVGTETNGVLKVGYGKDAASLIPGFKNCVGKVTYKGNEMNPDAALKTGCVVEGYCLGEKVYSATVAVNGDTNGDGASNISDMMQLKAYILHTQTFTDAQLAAGDVNGDGNVNISDFMRIKAVILKKATLD